MKTKLKNISLFCAICASFLVLLTACSEKLNDDSDGNDPSKPNDAIPTSLIGKSLSFVYEYDIYKTPATITPLNGTACDMTYMTKGASNYIYLPLSPSTAALTITGRQRVQTGTYIYFWELTLHFTSPNKGTLSGTYMAKTGFVTPVTGTFSIN